MKIINKFMSLKTWQKLGIGIALLTIFKYFVMNNFIINVKAESNDDIPSIVMIDLDSGLPITDSLACKNNYCSNFMTNEELSNIGNYSTSFKYNMSIPSNNNYSLQPINFPGYKQINHENYYINGFYYTQNGATFNTMIRGFDKNTHYSMIFSLESDGIENFEGSFNTDDFIFDMQLKPESGQALSILNYINNLDITYYPGGSITNNQQFSFLKINFDTLATFPSDRVLYSINISTKYDTSEKYFFKSSEAASYTSLRFFTFVMDANLELIPSDNSNEYFGFSNGEPLNQQIYENCDTLDIACHVRNIQRGVENFGKNLIYNIINMFKYVFVPDFKLIQKNITDIKEEISLKYPDITGLFDFFEVCSQRFQNLQPKTTISFPGVKVPGFDTYLIQPFTYDLAVIINDSSFSFYYQLSRIVISVFIMIGFVLFELRIIKSILHSLPVDFGGGN